MKNTFAVGSGRCWDICLRAMASDWMRHEIKNIYTTFHNSLPYSLNCGSALRLGKRFSECSIDWFTADVVVVMIGSQHTPCKRQNRHCQNSLRDDSWCICRCVSGISFDPDNCLPAAQTHRSLVGPLGARCSAVCCHKDITCPPPVVLDYCGGFSVRWTAWRHINVNILLWIFFFRCQISKTRFGRTQFFIVLVLDIDTSDLLLVFNFQ